MGPEDQSRRRLSHQGHEIQGHIRARGRAQAPQQEVEGVHPSEQLHQRRMRVGQGGVARPRREEVHGRRPLARLGPIDRPGAEGAHRHHRCRHCLGGIGMDVLRKDDQREEESLI